MNNNPNYIESSKLGGQKTKQKWEKIKNDYLKNSPSKCKNCSSVIEYKKRKNTFCSNSCAASYSNLNRNYKPTEEHKEKTKNTIINKSKKIYYSSPKVCTVCGSKMSYENRRRKTCSDKCLQTLNKINGSIGGKIGGRISAKVQSKKRRSKNEKLFAELCINHFKDVLTNEPIFNGWDADVIIKDIKVAVLWNGKWHYEQITKKHSVKQVQNRDKIKIDEIKKSGYIPYVIKDMGSFNIDKVNREFKSFIKKFDL